MFESKISKIFESTTVSEYLSLKRVEMDDQTFMKLLGLKPGEVNIILSRTASFIRNDGKDKSRKELINDILEVLERSSVSRNFVGIGLQQEYKLFKGFPVRTGDPYENMPEVGHELALQPQEVYIGWCTDATKAREIGAKYDASKGEPIGGLLVETHVDSTKILFDVNAVLRTCKAKLTAINQYNTQCAPGKSISKANVDFLATQAPEYHEELEIVTSSKVVNTRVLDKWTWDNSGTGGNKVVKWLGNSHPDANTAQPTQGQEAPAEQTSTEQPTPNPAAQENLKEMFRESDVKEDCPACTLNIHSYHMDEGFMDQMKKVGNWISKTAAVTVRGKTMKYLDTLRRQYAFQKQVYELAQQFSQKVDPDPSRQKYAAHQIARVDLLIQDAEEALARLQQNAGGGLTFANVDTAAPVQEEKHPLQASLEGVFNESTLGIFDRVADAKVQVTDRVTSKQLDGIFNKLIRALEQHYSYRLKALGLQRELLVADYNSYKGTRFESQPSVQKLKEMISFTGKSIRIVQAMKSEFDKNKHDAGNFNFTGNPAPRSKPKAPEEKAQVVALDKQEDTIDKVADDLAKTAAKNADAKTQTVPQEPTKEPETVPTAQATNPADVVNSIDKGFGDRANAETQKVNLNTAPAEEPKAAPVAPELVPDEAPKAVEPVTIPADQIEPVEPEKAPEQPVTAPVNPGPSGTPQLKSQNSIQAQLRSKGFVSFKNPKTAASFLKTHPNWTSKIVGTVTNMYPPVDTAKHEPTPASNKSVGALEPVGGPETKVSTQPPKLVSDIKPEVKTDIPPVAQAEPKVEVPPQEVIAPKPKKTKIKPAAAQPAPAVPPVAATPPVAPAPVAPKATIPDMNKLVDDKAFQGFMDNVSVREDAVKELADTNAELATANSMKKPLLQKRAANIQAKLDMANRNLKAFRDNQPEKFGTNIYPENTYDTLLTNYRQKKAEQAAAKGAPKAVQPAKKKNIKFKNKDAGEEETSNVAG